MDMYNIFKAPTKAFEEMLHVNGQPVYHNGEKRNAIITNPDIREFNDKYISTDYKLIRGDYIFYDDCYWMIWNQVNVARAESFKGIMRQAEHDVIFNLFYTGVTNKYLLKVPAIIQRTSDYTQRIDSQMILMDSEVHLFIRDTSSTRRIINLVNKADGEVVIGNRNYDIIGASFEKKGYIDFTCRLGINNTATDYVNNIYWNANGKPANWQDQYDTTFYEREGIENLPSVPNGYQTSITLSTSRTNVNESFNGTVTAEWTEEANRTSYRAFRGYLVHLISNGAEVAMTTTNALSYTFSNLNIGDYSIEVFSRFEDNLTVLPVVSGTIKVEDGSISLPPSTEVTDINATYYNDASTSGTLLWSMEIDKEKYTGFNGYRVRVWGGTMFGGDFIQKEIVVTTEEANIGNKNDSESGWWVTIESIFTNGTTTVYMQPKQFESNQLTVLPNEPPLW